MTQDVTDFRPAPWRMRLEAKRDHPDPNVRRWELGIDQQILACRFYVGIDTRYARRPRVTK